MAEQFTNYNALEPDGQSRVIISSLGTLVDSRTLGSIRKLAMVFIETLLVIAS